MRKKRRNARMKSELGQSVDHFKRAASIAAQETSSTVGPRISAARDRVQPTVSAARDKVQPAVSQARDVASSGWESAVATITPLVAAATQTGKDTAKVGRKSAKVSKKTAKKLEKRANKVLNRRQSSGRKSTLFGLGLIGVAVGVGAAYVLRRRQQAQWDEYDPAPAVTEPVGADDAAFEPDTTAPVTIADTTTDVRTQN
jgi:hypothetical protein